MKIPVNIFWFRRDLRLHDNAGLYNSLKSGNPVLPIFIFDKIILEQLEDKRDRRVEFIQKSLSEIQAQLAKLGSSLLVKFGTPLEAWKQLTEEFEIKAVFTNHDYEPYAKQRDAQVQDFLKSNGISFHTFKDQVIFEKGEVLKDDGTPYLVYTPYSKRWKSLLNDFYLKSYPTEKHFSNFLKTDAFEFPSLSSIGFDQTALTPPHSGEAGRGLFPPKKVRDELIKNYGNTRDYPGIEGTSKLSVHLRFGTISIRELARQAQALSEKYFNELIWREFYQMILWHFPNVEQSFKRQYDRIIWDNNEAHFQKWCEGKTGYPIVDAGMRELNETGYMHNRVRMIVASFLTKHLLIDWRWGEAYFAEKLLDFELASNNGGWQWAAGSGCDAAPYFRVFNPYLQTQKFDPELKYIKQWVPELDSFDYPQPIIEHEFARKRVLATYKIALG
ncbi:MAG: deoxyribodipyrimidine photo-lyase [Chitinophagales bacterium]|nr:deoxyribodipyrimidine photo-lyase [Chitinophagales bacterium]